VGVPPYSTWEDVLPGVLFHSNNFATSMALAEVYTLPSAILVVVIITIITTQIITLAEASV